MVRNKIKRVSHIFILTMISILGFGVLFAQTNSKALPILLPESNSNLSAFHFERIFPHHIQQNPQQLAPLCRMELKIERKSPIGMWFRIDDNACRQQNAAGLAYFRFRWTL